MPCDTSVLCVYAYTHKHTHTRTHTLYICIHVSSPLDPEPYLNPKPYLNPNLSCRGDKGDTGIKNDLH